MATDCTFFFSPMAFTTVCALYCSADGSALLILPLVNGFQDGVRAVLLSGWRPIAHSFSRQQLSRRFACCIAPQMAAHCSFFRSSMAFMVCMPFCSANGSGLLILLLVNGFPDGLRAILLSGWQRIADTSAHQQLSHRFACRISQRMSADCSFFRSSTAFTVCALQYLSTAIPMVCALQLLSKSALHHSSLPLIDEYPFGLYAIMRVE